MELIPILSTIILVATISTFILAIGAYILFKIQEKRADQFVQRGQEMEKADIVEPAIVGDTKMSAMQPDRTKILEGNQHAKSSTVQKSNTSKPEQKSKESIKKKKPTGNKFMKFDSLGYRNIDNDDDKEIINWR
jgi:Na+-transporting NADH:ubiquinone oxidoreductase subunit NqrC